MTSIFPQPTSNSRSRSETQFAVNVIRRNVELEARLIDDSLDLTAIKKDKIGLNLEATDIHTVLRNALGIFDRGDVALVRPNHFSDRRISGVCDGKKNYAQYFDRTCCNFCAPSGGCTLPERMSLAATGLP